MSLKRCLGQWAPGVRVARTGIGIGLVLGILGTLVAQWGTTGAKARVGLKRESFHAAIDIVLDQYVEPVDANAMMGRGLKHMVSGLDPHSYYLTAAERGRASLQGQHGTTTGLLVRLHPARAGHGADLEVAAVLPGSAAEREGLRPGDRILELDGRRSEFFLSQMEAELLLSGREGDRVELLVQRGHAMASEEVSLTVHKARNSDLVAGVVIERQDRRVAHMKIRSFRSGTGRWFVRTLEALLNQRGTGPVEAVILDLRGNPGGEVAEALIVADYFIAEGILTRTRGRGGRILREERAHRAGTNTEIPLVVVQDRRSASASELLAVALQEHGRAMILGERSYGKGTVQQVTGLDDGSLLTLTIARYFSPKDRLIDGNGVSPDVAIDDSFDPIPVAADLALATGLR